MSSLVYRRLDPAKREFRLLEIKPAQNLNDPLDCRLVTVRLSEEPEYIALSSLYGDSTDLDKIWVGGRNVTLTTHQVAALKNIRAVFYPTISRRFQRKPVRTPHSAPRWLRQLFGVDKERNRDQLEQKSLRVWLDMVCVNQRDDNEKSRQLSEMRTIYRSAELVVGWLGPKMEHTDAAMMTLAEIEDAMPARWGDPGDKEKHPENYSPEHRWAEPITHIWAAGPDGEIPFLMPHWVGCNDFMGRPYFQRRWILEELAMARFPTFLIGDTVVPWKQVLRLNRMMEEFKFRPSNVIAPVSSHGEKGTHPNSEPSTRHPTPIRSCMHHFLQIVPAATVCVRGLGPATATRICIINMHMQPSCKHVERASSYTHTPKDRSRRANRKHNEKKEK